MPPSSVVGPVKSDQRRVVGIFYITWHSDSAHKGSSPYAGDVSRILAADPKARLDAKHPLWTEGAYHWGEPEVGYFLSKDEYVIRKDMSMLADAGVDVLIMDVTNAVRYWDEWEVIFAVMEKMKAEGNRVPQFCFWAFNGPVITVVQDLYDKIYKAGQVQGPLVHLGRQAAAALQRHAQRRRQRREACKTRIRTTMRRSQTDPKHPHYGDPDYTEEFYKDYTKEVKSFFTLRTMWWGYWEWAGKRFVGTEDNWSFGLDLGDKRVAAMTPGRTGLQAQRPEGRGRRHARPASLEPGRQVLDAGKRRAGP